jgi:glutamine cyclotransferase
MRKALIGVLIAAIILFFFLRSCESCNKPPEQPDTTSSIPAPSNINYNIIATYTHDTSSFIQGLELHDGFLYEGTGLEGHSQLMKVNIKDGKAIQKIAIEPTVFGEGITILNNKIYQLTWQNHKVFVYDLTTFKKTGEFNWEYEGWGLTNDRKNLIISTGSNQLYFVEPTTFKIQKIVSVNNNNGPVNNLNELEWVDGKIYANIWETDYIVRINPETGNVEARLDLSGILEKSGMNRGPK